MKWLIVAASCLAALIADEAVNGQTSPAPNRGASTTVTLTPRPRRPLPPRRQMVVRRPAAPAINYAMALRRYRHERHTPFWWKQHYPTIVLAVGGFYYLDASYWYPAWGYDSSNSYYDYDGPIYTYGNLLPDQVIYNVQRALQDLGYYGGVLSGSLSGATRAAIAAFQQDSGLIVTGVIDTPTIDALELD